MPQPILSIRDLHVSLRLGGTEHAAVRGVSLDLNKGEVLAIVGESGSGKSLTALSVLGLLPRGIATISGGEIHFDGKNLAQASNAELDRVRGSGIGIIFQEPLSALNPVMRVGDQIIEGIVRRGEASRKQARKMALETLIGVRISDPERRMKQYPHELSGGMRQRAMIALALVSNPAVLIADEPTTALDVTVQAQILSLLKAQQKSRDLSMIIITHDLGIVAEVADRVAVMYAGEIVEAGEVETILSRPKHPYTLGLLSCLPEFSDDGRRLAVIAGSIPSVTEAVSGCVFKTRCPLYMRGPCDERIALTTGPEGHAYRCIRPIGSDARAESEQTRHA